MTPQIINRFGRMTGWTSVTSNMLGRDLEGVTELEYSDEQEKEDVQGAGEYPVGRGYGNTKAKASVTLYIEEVRALQASLGKGVSLCRIKPFDLTAQFEYGNEIVTDRLHNCEFTGTSVAVKQGDKVIAMKMPLIVSHVTWNAL